MLKSRDFPTAMILPLAFPADDRRHRDRHPPLRRALWQAGDRLHQVRRLSRARRWRASRTTGCVARIKYATVRTDPRRTPTSARCSTSSTQHRRQRHRRAAGDHPPARLRARRASPRARCASRRTARCASSRSARQALGRGRGGARDVPAAREPARRASARSACCTKPSRSPASPTWDRCCRCSPTSPTRNATPSATAALALSPARRQLAPHERAQEDRRRAAQPPLVRRQRPALVRPSLAHRADGLRPRRTTRASR